MSGHLWTLVLLPGLDGTGRLFAPLLSALGHRAQAQVLAYPPDQVLDYEALTALVRRALPTGRPFVLLGESFSGPIAITLAAERPAGLRGLVLCNTFARNPRPGLAGLRHLLPLLPVSAMPAAGLDLALLGSSGTPALRQSIAEAVRQVKPAVLRARLHAVATVDVSSRLSAVQVPCLYLRGTLDRLVPPRAAVLVAQRLPATETEALRAPHALLQTAPVESARSLLRFVERVVG